MRGLVLPLLAVLCAAIPLATRAEEICYKPKIGNDPIPAGTRACRLNALVDEWLSQHNIETEWWLQTYQRVGEIGGNDLRHFFDPRPAPPRASVEVYYLLTKDESVAATEMIRFRPGYFEGLERVLKQQARTILCETVGWDEEAFISSGGEIVYKVGLRPSVYNHRTPDWFVKIEIPQNLCEAN
jgi:hypothetical protein